MPKPFDNVTRYLNWLDPLAWPKLLQIQAKSIRLCNADLSTVNSQADLLLLIDEQWALHVENESSSKTDTGRRIFLKTETDSKTAGELWTAIDVIMGLRYTRQQIEHLLKGVRNMEESVTYQAIVEKGEAIGVVKGVTIGEANEAREILLKLGTQRFGEEPSHENLAILKKIDDKIRLEDLILRSLVAKNWNELMN